ncbi:hypothetical protein QN277_011619 [Acacia crassicarpa]|uniref:Uncharacterized protein n=1 Tax=Acacia crassicarpa TaxID=499986 RepID=A0AAE1TDM6_9FABA|nr:hypothetical protein QN277_011619 [Acacia crassicarpa]
MGHASHSSPIHSSSTDPSHKAFSFLVLYKLGGHGLAFTLATSGDFKALPAQYLRLHNFSDVGDSSNLLFTIKLSSNSRPRMINMLEST